MPLVQPFGFFGGAAFSPYMDATGGTITTSGSFKFHTFTADGTFEITNTGTGAFAFYDYVIIGSGEGGRSANNAGHGGAAGIVRSDSAVASVLGTYSIVVGEGGAGGLNSFGDPGESTTAFGSTATGGGVGTPGRNADFTDGGSPSEADAGIGGAGAGGNGSNSNGGDGVNTLIGTNYGGGGFGGRRNNNPVYGPGGYGGGAGGNFTTNGSNGTSYGAGGGGSCYSTRPGGRGADGVCVIKYQYQA